MAKKATAKTKKTATKKPAMPKMAKGGKMKKGC
jgi:hypothetical protein